MCWLNECDDCTLRSPSVTNCWAQHGNVEFRGLDPIKPSVLSSNFILSASLKVKLELEIHLVSSVSLVGFKADCACFSAKSSQIGLRTLNVVYGSGASHLKFLQSTFRPLLIGVSTSFSTINYSFEQSPWDQKWSFSLGFFILLSVTRPYMVLSLVVL